jgi:hypothetical protein
MIFYANVVNVSIDENFKTLIFLEILRTVKIDERQMMTRRGTLISFSSIEENRLLSLWFDDFQRFGVSISHFDAIERYSSIGSSSSRKLLLRQRMSNSIHKTRSRPKIESRVSTDSIRLDQILLLVLSLKIRKT